MDYTHTAIPTTAAAVPQMLWETVCTLSSSSSSFCIFFFNSQTAKKKCLPSCTLRWLTHTHTHHLFFVRSHVPSMYPQLVSFLWVSRCLQGHSAPRVCVCVLIWELFLSWTGEHPAAALPLYICWTAMAAAETKGTHTSGCCGRGHCRRVSLGRRSHSSRGG